MKSIHISGIFLLLIAGVFFSPHSKAQTGEQDTAKVSEPVRNIAYGSQPAWMVSGAISSVSGVELGKSFTLNLGNNLIGRLPGLTVMQGGGEPGLQSPTLYVRGTSTFGSGKNVLIIVDGYESYYDYLVPEEIESITVLKDASATAMYGSKGANGVLLVTTKRGLTGPLKVSFSTQQGVSSPTDRPEFLGSYDFATLYNEGYLNDGGDPLTLPYSQEDLDAYQDGSDPYFHPDVDWYDQLLRKAAYTSNYNLNFRGGSDVIRYFVDLNVLTSEGLYKRTGDLSGNSINSKYSRFNFRANIDINITKNLSSSLNFGGAIDNKANPAATGTGGIFGLMASIPPNAFPVYNPNGTYGGNNIYSNPWGDLLETGFYTSNGRPFQVSMDLKRKLDFLTKGLSISAEIGFVNNFTSLSSKSREYFMMLIAKDPSDNIIYTKIGENTSLASSEGEADSWRSMALRSYLTYHRTFNKTTLDGVMMFNSSNYTFRGGGVPYRDKGLFGRYTVSHANKYVGELSFGYNGSASFPTGSNWGLFPAASLGWIASNESFLENSDIFTFLKVRGSYGMTGNDNIGSSRRYMWLEDYIYMNNYFFGTTNTSISTIAEGQLADSSITWEKQKQFNLGVEATLFNRLDISVDIFQQDRYDILTQPYLRLPQFIGVSNAGLGNIYPQENAGKVTNKGFEAMLRLRSNESSNLQWFVQADIWYAKNKIVYNSEALQLFDYLYRTGRPIGQPFMLEFDGFFADQTDIDNSAVQNWMSRVVPGDIKYVDQNDDDIIDQNDLYPVGNPSLPFFNGSINAGISYKGFDVEIMFQGVTGRSITLPSDYYYAFQNNGKVSEAALGRWTTATAATATYPRLSASNNLNNYRASSFWQKDGSFLKLRSLEMGYNFPENLTAKVNIEKARVFINGTNLLSFDHMDFIDPETTTGYPPVRTFSLGIRVNM